MSEQRFELRKYGDSWEVYDNETFECYTIHTVSGLLNEQQATIDSLQTELELISGEKLFSRRELERTVKKQQANIEQLQDLCGKSDGENAKLRIENKRLQEENEQLLRYKYFVKAVEVFTDCPISETIADYSDGELFDEEEQLEFGKKMLEQEKEGVSNE